MSYQLVNNQQIYRIADSAWIPVNEENRDYREYLEWVAAGNVAEQFPIQEPTIEEKRLAEYPSITEHLEALYEARKGSTAKIEAIDAQITATNEKYPE